MTWPRVGRRGLLAGIVLAQSLTLLQPAAAQSPPLPERRPLLVVRPQPEARLPVRLSSAQVRIDIAGTVARTTVELAFHNPNDRVLEGELQFPLLDGQSVTGFALDIDGQLREAVPVPKATGRQVFDDITRQQVDPALLQVTQGNNHSLRLYPIPARGSRRVVLQIAQPLDFDRTGSGGYVYRLPLAFAESGGTLDVEARVVGPGSVQARIGAQSLPVRNGRDEATLRWRDDRPEALGVMEIRRAGTLAQVVTTQTFRGKHYVHAEIPAYHRLEIGARRAPERLGLVWDASGSRAARDAGKELALLDAWFRQIRSTDVVLRVVRDVAEPDQAFRVRDGDWSALRSHLKQLVYDGGTSAALPTSPPADVDLTLVFTDGLLNFGAAATAAAATPMTAISSSVSADLPMLRRLAEATGGDAIDLTRVHVPEALRTLSQRRARIVALEGDHVTELVAASRRAGPGRSYRIAGVLTAPRGMIRVTLQQGNGATQVVEVPVEADKGASALGVAAHEWAAMRLSELLADEGRHAAAIERLGMHFGLPTSRTSLIVLDNPEDYARHGIDPPRNEPRLVEAVKRLAALRQQASDQASAQQLARVTKEFEARWAWWNRPFPKGEKPAPPPAPPTQALTEDRARRSAAEASAQRMAGAAPSPVGAARPSAPPPPVTAEGAARPSSAAPPAATIALKKWSPDSAPARRMREAVDGAAAYSAYLDERPGHLDSTAFFLDAADILVEKKEPRLAARVVSNLAEMNLENRHVLRILAYRLMQMNEHALALPVLERVRTLAPDEPQSWRDLALAQAALGRHQAAVDALWRVVTTPWHGRFPGIELIALTELNAVAAAARAGGHAVDTSAVPAELQKHMPVAMRVVLSWDADNTDIDLWVTDPNAEKAYYGHRLTYQGGAMSRDFTGGYGPEEFSLREPKAGKYKVQAQFYGHRQQIVAPSTTLMLQFFTGFGTPQQKMEQVVVRLSGPKALVDVGEFEIAGTDPR